jgi:hypothetical protein
MSSHALLPLAVDRLPRSPVRLTLVRLRTRLHQGRLDAALAAGGDPWVDAELLVRAAELGAAANRRKLSGAIVRLVRTAESGHRPLLHGVRIRRSAVLAERDALLAVAARLRAPGPVPVSVPARITRLLADGVGPVFAASTQADALRNVLAACLAELSRL